MRRELQTVLAASVLGLALAALPGPAEAGVIVTDLKTGRPTERYQSTYSLFTNVNLVAEGSSGGDSSTTDEEQGGKPGKPGPGQPVTLLGDNEYAQLQAGLITEEEALAGCGGASVAGGRSGFAAMALVALFLVLRRRR